MTAADPVRAVESSQALDRGLRLLALLAAADRGLSVSELAEGLGTSRAAVYRLVTALEGHAMVRRPTGNGPAGSGSGSACSTWPGGCCRSCGRPPAARSARWPSGPARPPTSPSWTAATRWPSPWSSRPGPTSTSPTGWAPGTRSTAAPPAGRSCSAGPLRSGTDITVTAGELQPGAHGVAAPVRDVAGLEASVGVVALADLDADLVGPAVVEAAAAVARTAPIASGGDDDDLAAGADRLGLRDRQPAVRGGRVARPPAPAGRGADRRRGARPGRRAGADRRRPRLPGPRAVAGPPARRGPGGVGRAAGDAGAPAHRRPAPRRGRAGAAAARPGPAGAARSRWPTTSTSTPPSSTPRTSGGSSARTPRRSRPTGSTSRSATTAGPARSRCPAPTSSGPRGSAGARTARADVRAVGAAGHRGRGRLRRRRAVHARHPGARPRTGGSTSSACCWSTTGARGTSRRGSTSRSGRSWASRSSPRCRPGWCRWPRWRTPSSSRRPRTRAPLDYLRPAGPGLALQLEVRLNGHVVSRPPAAAALLDRRPAARPSHRQRRLAADRRPLRLRHRLRRRAGPARLAASS